jgi:hypothetical protein
MISIMIKIITKIRWWLLVGCLVLLPIAGILLGQVRLVDA